MTDAPAVMPPRPYGYPQLASFFQGDAKRLERIEYKGHNGRRYNYRFPPLKQHRIRASQK